jgi:hypothetical protein
MKKITALLVALSLFATTAFAAPLSVAASLSTPAQTGVSSEQTRIAPEAFSAIDETGDLFADALFADVGGIPLTTAEADQVDGGCIIPPLPMIIVAVVVLLAAQACSPPSL